MTLRQEEVVKAKEAARAVAEAERDRLVAEVKGWADGPVAVAVAEKVVEAVQEYGILPHSHTYYCLLFSLYHMFIIFVISY